MARCVRVDEMLSGLWLWLGLTSIFDVDYGKETLAVLLGTVAMPAPGTASGAQNGSRWKV
ncbi:MAG: hypothetical protein AOY29_13375 [Alcanivorax borkumensis]|nr:MAG: hypothetical protein AOY29_13375 [Alcanivorax borkumensis]